MKNLLDRITIDPEICNGKPTIPGTNREFNDFKSFKTHNLDVLLALSGIEEKVKTQFLSEWSSIAIWDPEARYYPTGTIGKSDAVFMIESAEKLLKIL